MSILVNDETRVIVQGLGKFGTFHAQQCRDYGTQIVGAISPGKGGTVKEGFPLFNTMAEGNWLGIAMPEAYGGAGLGIAEAAIMMQAVAESGAAMSGATRTGAPSGARSARARPRAWRGRTCLWTSGRGCSSRES